MVHAGIIQRLSWAQRVVKSSETQRANEWKSPKCDVPVFHCWTIHLSYFPHMDYLSAAQIRIQYEIKMQWVINRVSVYVVISFTRATERIERICKWQQESFNVPCYIFFLTCVPAVGFSWSRILRTSSEVSAAVKDPPYFCGMKGDSRIWRSLWFETV